MSLEFHFFRIGVEHLQNMKLVVFGGKFCLVLSQFRLDSGAGKYFPLGEFGWCVLKLIRQITGEEWGEGTINTQRICYKPLRFQRCFSEAHKCFEEIFENFEETLP